jgi:integrase
VLIFRTKWHCFEGIPKPIIGFKLSSITKQDIQKLQHVIGMNKGIYTANRLLALLSTVFNKTIEYDLWERPNPASGIKKFREKSRDRFLQSDELPKSFSALLSEPNTDIRDSVLLALLTGARRTNVLSMQWSNINLERAEWCIPETKNGEAQTVALSGEALEVLHNRKVNACNECLCKP